MVSANCIVRVMSDNLNYKCKKHLMCIVNSITAFYFCIEGTVGQLSRCILLLSMHERLRTA